jgi:predicted transcriptional regulator
MATTHITVRISPELKEKLSAFAKAERRTLSQFVAIQLEDVVTKLERDARKFEEGRKR